MLTNAQSYLMAAGCFLVGAVFVAYVIPTLVLWPAAIWFLMETN